MGVNGMYAQQRVKAGTEFREAVTRHQALTKDLRPLIRAIGKEREEFSNYLKFYKLEFIEPLLKGHSALRHDLDIDTCVYNFNIVMQNIDAVFGDLLSLSYMPIESITTRTPQQHFKPPPGLENIWVVKQDQQENSQAREVVRRVERRLNGWLDGSSAPDRKLSPREEADVLIAEATSSKNLAHPFAYGTPSFSMSQFPGIYAEIKYFVEEFPKIDASQLLSEIITLVSNGNGKDIAFSPYSELVKPKIGKQQFKPKFKFS